MNSGLDDCMCEYMYILFLLSHCRAGMELTPLSNFITPCFSNVAVIPSGWVCYVTVQACHPPEF